MNEKQKYLKKLIKLWIYRNDDDLKSAESEFKETGNYTLVTFLCHLIVERYLKIYLMRQGVEIKGELRTHDLIFLLNECSKFNKNILDWQEETKFLTKFDVDTRYPADWGQMVIKRDAEKSLEYTKKFVEFIEVQLSK